MTRPAVGSVSAEQSTSGVTLSPPANTRGLWLVLFRGSNTSSNHDDGGSDIACSYGNVALSLGPNNTQVQVHGCAWYLDNHASYVGRSDNVVRITNTTLGTGINQYRWRLYFITHATHMVVLAAHQGVNALANGGNTTVTLNPGAGVEARAIVAGNSQSFSAAMNATVGLTSPTNHYSGVGGPTGTSHTKRSDSGEITGSTASGFSWGSGSNTQRVVVGSAWKEGSAIASPRSRSYILATLPSGLMLFRTLMPDASPPALAPATGGTQSRPVWF